MFTVPALIIHDEQDREIPFEGGEALSKVWKNSKLVRTNGLGHRRILRDSQVISKAVEYLTAGH